MMKTSSQTLLGIAGRQTARAEALKAENLKLRFLLLEVSDLHDSIDNNYTCAYCQCQLVRRIREALEPGVNAT